MNKLLQHRFRPGEARSHLSLRPRCSTERPQRWTEKSSSIEWPEFDSQDIWTATRESTEDYWSTPTNLGPVINSAAMEARATLSRDGFTMYFGSNRGGTEGESRPLRNKSRETYR